MDAAHASGLNGEMSEARSHRHGLTVGLVASLLALLGGCAPDCPVGQVAGNAGGESTCGEPCRGNGDCGVGYVCGCHSYDNSGLCVTASWAAAHGLGSGAASCAGGTSTTCPIGQVPVNYRDGTSGCAALCTSNSGCSSGCCRALTDGRTVCSPASYCGTPPQCIAAGAACAVSSQCCSGSCSGGVCRAAAAQCDWGAATGCVQARGQVGTRCGSRASVDLTITNRCATGVKIYSCFEALGGGYTGCSADGTFSGGVAPGGTANNYTCNGTGRYWYWAMPISAYNAGSCSWPAH